MAETVEEPEDRTVGELLKGLKQSMKDIKEGNTFSAEEVREEVENRKLSREAIEGLKEAKDQEETYTLEEAKEKLDQE